MEVFGTPGFNHLDRGLNTFGSVVHVSSHTEKSLMLSLLHYWKFPAVTVILAPFSLFGDQTLLMQSHHWQTFPIYITFTHTLPHTHLQCRVITDKNFPFTRGWEKITVLRTSLRPFNLTPSCANAHSTHSQTHWINRFTPPCRVKAPFSSFKFY